MISDLLSDAVSEIERYETDPVFMDCYKDPALWERLRIVKAVMNGLRAELDCDVCRIVKMKPYISPAGQAGLRSVECEFTDGTVARWQLSADGQEG